MLPITNGTVAARTRDRVRVKDGYLAEVLNGHAYLVFDGAMGTMLQKGGLDAGELPELLCLDHADAVSAVHRSYVQAGAQVITTNTFGANERKLEGRATVDEVFGAAIACALSAHPRYVAADIGPTGALLEPMGTLSFDEAYHLFAQQVRAADKAGADLFVIETMADLLEAKAAVLAAKENSDLPVFATMTFDETGRTFLGTSPNVAAYTLDALGVNALGVNCSLGPDALVPIVEEMLSAATCPVMVQANAGLPRMENGKTVFSVSAQDYAASVRKMVDAGASIIGGCCGTDPSYIERLASLVENRVPVRIPASPVCVITSAQQALEFRGRSVGVIGERINPTGKKRLKAALREGDFDYVVNEAISQDQAGADALDVNAGLPEIDEAACLCELVKRIQSVTGLPLQIDSSDPVAVEAAVRAYAGKALINSVNGKEESLRAILPIARHYGCAVVGLTLDENGIPPSAEERFAIACRIVEAAEQAGIPREDVFIDCLVMSASTNQNEVADILRAVTMVKERLGVRTVLGVSNISFGLPARPVVNATFLAAAFSAGLDLPILNPLSDRYREVVDTWRVLCGHDVGARRFIEGYANYQATPAGKPADPAQGSSESAPAGPATCADDGSLHSAIVQGRRKTAGEICSALLNDTDPLDIINHHLIPALDEVGDAFERGTFFLPQLMASAEAAKAGFDVIKAASAAADVNKGTVALATVKGDIHDIGKNIVRMLLENYGYRVIDLGRDVDPQVVLDCVKTHGVKLVGLSALMTTSIRGMEDTIALLRAEAPDVRVLVGGAVLNPEYAQMVGADWYAKDAAETVRIAGEFFAKTA
ncbi:homocysteine S-methyltransferase family protein [Gordonibacter sp. Marseille-P4307]|uniref:homocysteine S-methyltransferase family protein n=1 Tax=Gordonibacter sp. Marseille-P4307 TaxID=2161815 RepID=UPI000F52F4A5|nr:homocysteine S-methyltransferase family protein [Gordonibacter sp. Marseille-P4307]